MCRLCRRGGCGQTCRHVIVSASLFVMQQRHRTFFVTEKKGVKKKTVRKLCSSLYFFLLFLVSFFFLVSSFLSSFFCFFSFFVSLFFFFVLLCSFLLSFFSSFCAVFLFLSALCKYVVYRHLLVRCKIFCKKCKINLVITNICRIFVSTRQREREREDSVERGPPTARPLDIRGWLRKGIANTYGKSNQRMTGRLRRKERAKDVKLR